ncbi:hypothetical protein BKH46_07395 [Helicobacter sp. 12S02634-8]|uniref:hypothetical protein n=1 Tax=Helicobacter sp. 12S02634-8 TaxID=1476199 RepID=UPI000BA64252|nr:hypothetical protein [Helicobacter sp. 12S02634-8]PAF46558.1 hypothetical protein BKH46_07395 [Helicobacter sp. 12S02634-8]
MQVYHNFQDFQDTHLIKGTNADYSPRYFFTYKGLIYQKMSFEIAYQNDFNYKIIDRLKDYTEIENPISNIQTIGA